MIACASKNQKYRKSTLSTNGMIERFSANYQTTIYCACIETPRINCIGEDPDCRLDGKDELNYWILIFTCDCPEWCTSIDKPIHGDFILSPIN